MSSNGLSGRCISLSTADEWSALWCGDFRAVGESSCVTPPPPPPLEPLLCAVTGVGLQSFGSVRMRNLAFAGVAVVMVGLATEDVRLTAECSAASSISSRRSIAGATRLMARALYEAQAQQRASEWAGVTEVHRHTGALGLLLMRAAHGCVVSWRARSYFHFGALSY